MEQRAYGRFLPTPTGGGAIWIALNWLPDIARWARVMAALATPGGFLYLAEFHPVHMILGDDDLIVRRPYFHDRDAPLAFDEPGTYADPGAATEHNRTVEWTHGLGSVVTAAIEAGLSIELLHEHDHTLFPRWPFLRWEDGAYHMPADMPSLPLMYSLRARKPA